MVKKRGDLDIRLGTVLAIPLKNNCWALGQVIHPGVHFYLGVVSKEFEEPLLASNIDGQRFHLYSWTNDAEVYRNHWRNLGIYDLQGHGPLPEYKVTISGEPMVESFSRDTARKFNLEKDGNLQYRKIRSPLLVQDAVQAALGHGVWLPFYDTMKEGP